MKKRYESEREGQMAFFDNYGIDYANDASILVDNTDGVYNGNILEFKLNIANLNKALFQAIKYLSKMRIKGEPVPATILLVDLNATTIYVYKSEDYFDFIHKPYTGAASKDNEGFVAGAYIAKYDYSDMAQSAFVKKLLKGKKAYPDEMFMPIDIDENCIVGWAERYYREKPTASKGDFLGDATGSAVKVVGEIRDPRHFKGLINPYRGKSNERFKYLMDCLNDRLSRKDLGAFYTPVPYTQKAVELVLQAVNRVPDGNSYIILDRCAGTGNLEIALKGLTDKNGNALIERCIVSTYEYYEYKVLQERIGSDVLEIIPPTEKDAVYENGKVTNADAMSEESINNPIIKPYVDDKHCTIILFENPPYRDSVADNNERKDVSAHKDFIFEEMKKELPSLPNANISTARDLTNRFIWSGFKYYLRYPSDSYVLFSPIKYWKTLGLADREFIDGFLFNRSHFHASPSSIACVLWGNKTEHIESIKVLAVDIDANSDLRPLHEIKISKAHKTFEPFFSRTVLPSDVATHVYCESNGEETTGRKCDGTSYTGEDIIAYQRTDSFGVDPKHVSLTRCTLYNTRGYYLRRSSYIKLLPLFVAKQYPQDAWFDKDIYFTSSDGGDAYSKDQNLLKSCLIYTCLSRQNKCMSFEGSDGRLYQNELCFDNSNAEQVPLALKDLHKFSADKQTALDDDEEALIELWNKILAEARQTKNYDPSLNYGVYQILKKLNTHHFVGIGKTRKSVPDYLALDGYLDTLRVLLKAYYKSHITNKLFRYELLK